MIKKSNINLLDCTLRDGGYYNNWCFDIAIVNDYLRAMSAVGIRFVELGFRSKENEPFKGPLAYTTEDYLSTLDIPENLDIGVMINCSELHSEGHLIEELFTQRSESKVSFVRIATLIEDIELAVMASKRIKDLGYLVAINLMQIADKSSSEIKTAISKVDKQADVIYFADSMGSLQNENITELVNTIKSNWSGDIGIHTHDNMGLALSNLIQAINDGVRWVDSTVTGMGRGAGNAKTELLLLNVADENDSLNKLSPLFSLIDNYFYQLKKKYEWGLNPYYFLSGKYGIHPSYVQEMLVDARYRQEDILVAIEYLRKIGAKKFNINTLNTAKNFYHTSPKGRWMPREVFNQKDVLVIGGGNSVVTHKLAIESYIKRVKPIVVALNVTEDIDNTLINFRAASHPIRLMADYNKYSKLTQPLIIPASMLPKDIVGGFSDCEIYDYGMVIRNDCFDFHENYSVVPSPLVLCYVLSILSAGNASTISLVGIDGFSFDDPRQAEIQHVLDVYNKTPRKVSLTSLTPTKLTIPSKSVYAF